MYEFFQEEHDHDEDSVCQVVSNLHQLSLARQQTKASPMTPLSFNSSQALANLAALAQLSNNVFELHPTIGGLPATTLPNDMTSPVMSNNGSAAAAGAGGPDHGQMQIRCKFGTMGEYHGQFHSPHGFCMGLNEEIIVADTYNHRIQVGLKLDYMYLCMT